MNLLSYKILTLRSRFLLTIRQFFLKNGFLEIDTPKLKKVPGMEPYLDPYIVSSPNGEKEGYLVTSPEYSLKQALSMGLSKIYEIAHAYRSGEKGSLHTGEFLMLEFYQAGINEKELMNVCIELFDYLEKNFLSCGFQREICQKVAMGELFQTYLNHGFQKEDLVTIISEKLPEKLKEVQNWRYDDLFFLVFLNFIEPRLPETPIFIYDYPKELASLARVENGIARRFEIYWRKVEIGNAFYELNDPDLQIKRFEEEQYIRKNLQKEVFPIDLDFIASLKRGLPEASGISIGLDRLLMIYFGHENLKNLSPYVQIKE